MPYRYGHIDYYPGMPYTGTGMAYQYTCTRVYHATGSHWSHVCTWLLSQVYWDHWDSTTWSSTYTCTRVVCQYTGTYSSTMCYLKYKNYAARTLDHHAILLL